MDSTLKNVINSKIGLDLTNSVCLSSSNISHMKNLLKKKYVSKKKMRKALEYQMEYLERIQKSKNEVLTIINNI